MSHEVRRLIQQLTDATERATRHLGDDEYIEVLEGVSCNLDAAVGARREFPFLTEGASE